MTRSYITASLPYVNAHPHLGYALELVQADAIARARRRAGHEVRLHTGTDEHALKNVVAARAAGLSTAGFVAANALRFEELAGRLGIDLDDFIRTSADPRHAPGVAALWRRSEEDFYRRWYEGDYCSGCEQFYAPADLVAGRCPEHGTRPERVGEHNWFFRLSRYQPRIHAVIASDELKIRPEPFRQEVLAWVDAGLEDISVSRPAARAQGWGVPVPGDPEQVVYVWWDALANYVTALGFGTGGADFDRWWAESDERIHLVGKGIVRFHTVYWPALLLSAGLPLPTHVLVHPYLTAGGAKIAKSTGNVVDPFALLDAYGPDPLRWWLLAAVGQVADTDYTPVRLEQKANADLANGLGNLASRIIALHPETKAPARPNELAKEVDEALASYNTRAAAEKIRAAVAKANQDLEQAAPWKNKNEEGTRALTTAWQKAYEAAEAALPLIPEGSERVLATLTNDEGFRSPFPSPWGKALKPTTSHTRRRSCRRR